MLPTAQDTRLAGAPCDGLVISSGSMPSSASAGAQRVMCGQMRGHLPD